MKINVSYNPETYDYYCAPVFLQFPSLEQDLLNDFARYKETGVLAHYFGRDTDYSRPDEIAGRGLMHLHVKLGNNDFDSLPKFIDKNDKQQLQWYRTTNSAVVYSQNIISENHYSIIAVFHPYAHLNANNDERMKKLADVATRFRESVLI